MPASCIEGSLSNLLGKEAVREFISCQLLITDLQLLSISCVLWLSFAFCMSFSHFLYIAITTWTLGLLWQYRITSRRIMVPTLASFTTNDNIYTLEFACKFVGFVRKAPLFSLTKRGGNRPDSHIGLALPMVLLSICAHLTHNNHPTGHIPKAEIESKACI